MHALQSYIPHAIGDRLGAGGYGSVYSMKRDPSKVIKISDRIYSDKRKENLAHVFSLLQQLRSVYIGRLYEYNFFRDNGLDYFYYISEKLYQAPGEKITSFISKWIDRPFTKLARIYYHDFHSGNIMQTKCGRAKICDLDGFTWE
jgi:hypothetical protein